MCKIYKILPVLLLTSALSLSSCVNEAKNPPKPQDTLARLVINYTIPDSNSILAVNFNALLTPFWKPQYRIDWNFGDSTGIISKFDTSILPHYYDKCGTYVVRLSILDTLSNTVLGRAAVIISLDSVSQWIDTNYLHGFTRIEISFHAKCLCSHETDSIVTIFLDNPIAWRGKTFRTENGSTFGGVLSSSGYSIDSGWCETYTSSWYAYGTHGIATSFSAKYLDYQGVNKVSQTIDSVIYLSTGQDAVSKISSLVDTAFGFGGTMVAQYPGVNHTKEYIYPDRVPTPRLRVKLYK